jgi:hypothetical protein
VSAKPGCSAGRQLHDHLERDRPASYRAHERHSMHGRDRCLAAHATTGAAVEMALRQHRVELHARAQPHDQHVRVAGRLGGQQVFTAAQQALAEQEAGGQLGIVAGRAHRDRERPARSRLVGRTDADLEGLFDCYRIGPQAHLARAVGRDQDGSMCSGDHGGMIAARPLRRPERRWQPALSAG